MINNYSLRLRDVGTYNFLIVGIMCLMTSINISAQCPQSLGCNDNIQISLDYQCFAEINPDIILEDERDNCDYMVTVLTAGDVVLLETNVTNTGDFEYPVIDGSFVGTPYKASVSFLDDNGTTISCWGWFTVEDKLPPTVTCIEDFTVDCSKDLSHLLTSSSLLTYCTEPGFADIDSDPNTISILLAPVTGSGSTEPWEIIDFIDFHGRNGIDISLVSATGSGSGGIVLSDGNDYLFNEDPVNSDIYTGEIQGVQALPTILGNSITLVIEDNAANQAALDFGVCVDINTTSFYTFQQNDNCDPNVEVIINRDETNSIECIDNITAQREIEYFTRDNAGLSTELCDFTIFFEKQELTDIEFPMNRDFSCDDPSILTDGLLDLSPENTGQPLLDSLPILEDNLCKLNVTFADDTFNLCGINTIKILRRWTALDWCAGEYAQSYQTIKVSDDVAPSFNTPPNDLVFETDRDCKGVVDFMPFDTIHETRIRDFSDCSDLNSLIVNVIYLPGLESDPENFNASYLNTEKLANNVFRASQLKNGYNTIKYILSDECGNETEKSFIIKVIDDAKPIAVCDQYTAVSIADNGWGRLYPESVNDGSYDECGGPISLLIKKDTTYCADLPEYEGDDLEFGEYISFCCQEGGLTMIVVMQVTDEGGRTNTCEVNVLVQDKTGLVVESCPRLVFDFDCTEGSQIDSTDVTGIPVIQGGCGNVDLRYEDSGSIDDICGDGIIIRRWFAELPGSTTELTSCEQTFNFTSDVTLNINSFDWPLDRDDATCANYASDFGDEILYNGVPINEANVCAHLSASYKDRVFDDVSGYCIKIIRTWTVIDFCLYDAELNPGQGIWSRNQVIKVNTDQGPELTNCQQDTTFSLSTINCEFVANFDAPEAFDDCLQEFIPVSEIAYEISTNGNVVASGYGDIANEILFAGAYTVTWSVEGHCNNLSTCSFSFDIEDLKAPIPYCRTGITTALTPPVNAADDPFLLIWANDFDLGTQDNCDSDINISFDKDDLTATSKRFTCDDLGLNTFEVWFTDDAGNQDFCVTTMIVQANGNICPDTTDVGMMIAGNIKTEFAQELENVTVGLQRMSNELVVFEQTNINGEFAFRNRIAYEDYKLNVVSNQDYLNGISTLDLVLIQRHILGLQPLESAYQMVAADVNSSTDITVVDLIELRKLILGVYDELPNNESWRFLDKTQIFPDQLNPWPLDETIDIYELAGNLMLNDFVGVKVGDVNGSVVTATSNSEIVSRSLNDGIKLTHDILELNSTDEYLIPFYFNNEQSVAGLQLALNFDNNLEIVDIESGRLNINETMFVIENGVLNLSWTDQRAIDCKKEDALFYITVKSGSQLKDDIFSIRTSGLRSELYDQNLNTLNIEVERKSFDFDNKLFQNIPNPFNGITTIEFELAKESMANLTIFGSNGKVVKTINNKFKKGINSVMINANDLNGNGIYYYQLETEYFSSTRKMILIE